MEQLVTALGDATKNDLRIFAGYSGWAAEQLLRELESGAWHVVDAREEWIFDTDPRFVWSRLHRMVVTVFA